MDDVILNRAAKSSKPDSGGANTRNYPVLGIVKNNVDPTRAGRIQVYIADLGSNNPDDSSGWTTVSYMSPFFGSIAPTSPNTGYGDYVANPTSYGFWNSPPDIGSTVICIFINGDPSYGYYVGCVPKPETLYMVPAIGSSEFIIANDGEAKGYGGATRLPVTNINTNNESISNSPNFINEPRPVHSYSAMIMNQQGIIRDPIRGPISSSAQRESPSRVGWGISTPGRPIYDGGYTDQTVAEVADSKVPDSGLKVVSRRGGHSIVLDDGDLIGQDQLVRIRSAQGHQILMSDDGQTLFIIHSNGQSYIELGKEGTIDMYSTNSVNIRTQGDLNLHADKNINIHAEKKLNIRAEELNVQTINDTNIKVGGNYSGETTGVYAQKVSGAMSMQSSGEASFASSSTTFINGGRINLNTGSSSTVPKSITAIKVNPLTDTLYDSTKGFAAAPGALKTIVSRAPAHMPWADAGKGVDTKTDNNADSTLPAAPSPAVETANKVASQTPTENPVTPRVAVTAPNVPAVSTAVNKETTGAMLGSAAVTAATGPAANATTQGTTIITKNNASQLVVGVLGQTPDILESGGMCKPGSALRTAALIQNGANAEAALSPVMFTGKQGVTDLIAYTNSVPAQAQAQVAAMQQSQAALTSAGAMTGTESPVSVSGAIMAGSISGIKNTLGVLKQASTVVGGPIASIGKAIPGLSGLTSQVNSLLNKGNQAASMAQSVLGGIGALDTALSTLNNPNASKGATASAFAAVLDQFKPLVAGMPQNLRAIAANNAKARSNTLSNLAKTTQSLIGTGRALGLNTTALSSIAGVSDVLNAAGTVQSSGSLSGLLSASSTLLKTSGSLIDNAGALGTTGIFASNGGLVSVVKQFNAPNTGSGNILQVASGVAGTINSSLALGNAKSIGGIIGAAGGLIGSVKSILPRGAGTASGVDALPGGSAATSVTTGPNGEVAVEGTQPVSVLINNASVASMTAAPVNQLTSALGPLGGTVSDIANSVASGTSSVMSLLKSGNTTLSSLATTGLPTDLATQLNSAMASVSSLGPNPVTAPVTGEATCDRAAIEAQSRQLLGDSRIPVPDFSGPSDKSKSLLEKLKEKSANRIELNKKYKDLMDQADVAKDKYTSLQNSLPKGSPEIEQAKAEWEALLKQARDVTKQMF